MKFKELIILLPCHSLEDFPQFHEGDEAAGLLANWTAMWHPALIAAAQSAPTWYRVDDPPSELADRLLLCPAVSIDQLSTGFAQRAKNEGACLIQRETERETIVARALESLDEQPSIDAELVADYLALGFCYLQIQLLTRQMRYSSNLDETHFNEQLVAGATAATEGDQQLAQEKLTACFDLLGEERDHYYSVDAFVVDLTLVADTTLGAALRDELASPVPTNLLLQAADLEQLAKDTPDTLTALQTALTESRASVIGGATTEQRWPLLPVEMMVDELQAARAAYQTVLDQQPTTFGRRTFGLGPLLPQLLDKLGYKGALHTSLDDGRVPSGTQIKSRWEGADGTALDAIAKPPLDGTKPETFLGFAQKLGESMDMDHVATLCIAHWPGHASPWYEDLKRCSKYGSTLGKFVTVDEYFTDTYMPGHLDRFEADQYRSPYLRQDIIRQVPDPVSSVARLWREQVKSADAKALHTLATLVTGDGGADTANEDQAARRFTDALPRGGEDPRAGCLVVNPCSFVRRVGVDVSELDSLPTVEKPVYAAAESDGRKHAVVDVPPMGFVWLTPGKTATKRKPTPALVEDTREKDGRLLVRNEFFEALINPTTGALQSLQDYSGHGNRLSQQLAFRTPGGPGQVGETYRDPDETASYSVMAADSVEVTSATTAYGEVTVRGRLLDREGETLADYSQRFSAWRGSRVLNLHITLEPQQKPKADPWNSYYACRFAWADEAADLFRTVNQTRHAANKKQLDAPLYLEIEDAQTRTAILTGGIPYHRRIGHRMLDSLLLVSGETATEFHLGIGVDLPQPVNEALSMIAPPPMLYETAAAPTPATSSWLFHLDARNVVATHWEPLIEDGSVVGFRARLLETTGRATRAKLSCFRAVASASRLDLIGVRQGDCEIDDGCIQLQLTASELQYLEARWS